MHDTLGARVRWMEHRDSSTMEMVGNAHHLKNRKPPETQSFAGTSRKRHAGDERINRFGDLAANWNQ
jgi:hypothetical protein